MKAILRGIRRIDYTKNGVHKQGIEIHYEREPLLSESGDYAPGSSICDNQYIRQTENNGAYIDKIRSIPLMSTVDLTIVSNGRFSELADIDIIL